MAEDETALKNNTQLIMGIIAIIAVVIRLMPFSKVFYNGTVHPIGFDSYYHMRRIFFSSWHFPGYISFDSYVDYPYGAEVNWPPLFDWAVSLFAIINGLGSPDSYIIEFAAASFPLILGIIAFVPLYYAASIIFDRNSAIFAAGILAILPANVDYSMFGFIDHHSAEILLLTATCAFFIAALKSSAGNNISIMHIENKFLLRITGAPHIYAAGAGIFLAISLLTWLGAPIFAGIIGVYAAMQFTLDLKHNRSSDYLYHILIVVYTVTLIILAPVIYFTVRPGVGINPFGISWFHVLLVGSLLVSVIILGIIARLLYSKKMSWYNYPLIIAILAAASVLLIRALSRELFRLLITGPAYLTGSGDVLGTISEAQPLFFTMGKLDLMPVMVGFGVSFFLAIPALVLFTGKMIRKKYPPEMLFFAVWTFIILVLALMQRRFINQLSINIVILTGYLLMLCFSSFSRELSDSRKKLLKLGVIVILLAAIILPNVYVIYLKVTNPTIPPRDWEESLVWLRQNSPQTSFYADPSETPEYGVMSWWAYGNWILYIAQRPVVTNNFQVGVSDAAKFFIEDDQRDASSILDVRRVRYIITSSEMVFYKYKNMALLAGENPDNYSLDGKMQNTMLWRLHREDGADMGSMRLIYESDMVMTPESVKIFEYVRGANITGQAAPGEVVAAVTNISTNSGRRFQYFNRAVVNETGWYKITVSYPTIGSAYAVRPVETYTLLKLGPTNQVLAQVVVRENEIVEGKTININAN